MSSAATASSRPLYDRLKARGAVFGSKLGWERPNWFAPNGTEPRDIYSMGRQNWFGAVGDEHRHVRETGRPLRPVAPSPNIEVTGKDAAAALSWIAANDVDKPVGRLTYTQMLNSRGGIECDLTVARLADDHFYIVTGTGFRTHDLAWIAEHIPAGVDAHITDVTEDFGTLVAHGPARARCACAPSPPPTFRNAAFPFGHVRILPIAGPRHPRAARHLCRRARLGAAHPPRRDRRPSSTR